eukprot:Sspe_Gene.1609::Locus_532_Transcript_2_2_Confidence_0.667_Length_2044::g.1609::m.1609
MTGATDKKLWEFELYAADDLGDRAYTVAGPTALTFQPLYHPHSVAPATVSVSASQGTDYPATAKTAKDAVVDIATLSSGTPTVKVLNGTQAYNGVPAGDLNKEGVQAGVAVVEFSGKPGVGVELGFGMGSGSLPTYDFGTKKAPRVSFTVPPELMAVEDVSKSNSCKDVPQGGSCTFKAYAMGQIPGVTSNNYYLSGEMVTGVATGRRFRARGAERRAARVPRR